MEKGKWQIYKEKEELQPCHSSFSIRANSRGRPLMRLGQVLFFLLCPLAPQELQITFDFTSWPRMPEKCSMLTRKWVITLWKWSALWFLWSHSKNCRCLFKCSAAVEENTPYPNPVVSNQNFIMDHTLPHKIWKIAFFQRTRLEILQQGELRPFPHGRGRFPAFSVW